VWRKLLRFRNHARSFIRMDIKSGMTVRFWTDLWHHRGRLIEITGEIGTQKLGIPRNATINEVLVDREWRFRRCRDRQIQTLVQEVRRSQVTLSAGVNDGVLWKLGPDDYGDSFSSIATWRQIRQQHDKVLWTKLVWFAQGVPRFAFITWLAFKDRLATGQRLRKWGRLQGCLFCGEPEESRDHLYFACPYTFTLWLQVVGKLIGVEPNPDWETTILQMLSGTHDRQTFILLRLVLQVSIYFIWRERNDRKHKITAKPVAQLARVIDKAVRNCIMSTKYHMNPKLRELMVRWFEAHMA